MRKRKGVAPPLEKAFTFLNYFYYFYYRLHTLRSEFLSSWHIFGKYLVFTCHQWRHLSENLDFLFKFLWTIVCNSFTLKQGQIKCSQSICWYERKTFRLTFFVRLAHFCWLNKTFSSNIFEFLFDLILDVTSISDITNMYDVILTFIYY